MSTELLSALQYVTGGFSLVAFITAAILLAYRSRMQSGIDILLALPEAERADSVNSLADRFAVDTSGLTKEQKLRIVLEQLNIRARRDKMVAIVLVIFGFLSAGVVIWVFPHQTTAAQLGSTSIPRASRVSANLCEAEYVEDCEFDFTDFTPCRTAQNWLSEWKSSTNCLDVASIHKAVAVEGTGHACDANRYIISCNVQDK